MRCALCYRYIHSWFHKAELGLGLVLGWSYLVFSVRLTHSYTIIVKSRLTDHSHLSYHCEAQCVCYRLWGSWALSPRVDDCCCIIWVCVWSDSAQEGVNCFAGAKVKIPSWTQILLKTNTHAQIDISILNKLCQSSSVSTETETKLAHIHIYVNEISILLCVQRITVHLNNYTVYMS